MSNFNELTAVLLTVKLIIVNWITIFEGGLSMENIQKEKVLKAIEQLITQREKKIQKRTSLPAHFNGETAEEWTLTQLHIVALINDHPSETNNTFLSKQLNVSKPAITKAINYLIEKGAITSEKRGGNQKAIYYALTDAGEKLALAHEQVHQKVIDRYNQLLDQFTESELDVVVRFLFEWTKQMDSTDILK